MALHCGHMGPVRDVLVCPGTLGWTVGLWPSETEKGMSQWISVRDVALHCGTHRDVLVCPGTLGWEGQWDCSPPLWDTWDLSGMS